MIIKIPEDYKYYRRDWCVSEIIDGSLKIYYRAKFEKIMYDITYKQKGTDVCYYCGEPLIDSNRTIDHMYSRAYGGISVPDNLVPSCSNCNNEKAFLNEQQYKKFITLKDKKEKKLFKQEVTQNNKLIIKEKGFILPEEWTDTIPINQIFLTSNKNTDCYPINEWNNEEYGKHYYSTVHFIEEYNLLPQPIVLDNRLSVIYGNSISIAAYKMGFYKVPVVVLENVCLSR